MKIRKSSECLVLYTFLYLYNVNTFCNPILFKLWGSRKKFLSSPGSGFLRLRKKHPLRDGISGAGKEVGLIKYKNDFEIKYKNDFGIKY